jgi:hypothetical protein
VADHELLIRDLSAVEDVDRTIEPCDPPQPGELLAWSFGGLMTQIAQQAGANDPAAFVLDWLETWDQDQVVNGFTVPARESMRPIITDIWLQASGGAALDLTKAPFRLAAIVNRMDLRRTDGSQPLDAGEARFVFNAVDLLNPECRRLDFNVILEFALPASTQEEVIAWADQWHALGDLDFGASFNDALQNITDVFTQSFNQLRTNELAVTFVDWEQRAFSTACSSLALTPLEQTPDPSFADSSELAAYINDHAAEILTESHQVPPEMLGGYIQQNLVWDAPEIQDHLEVRHHFGMQTCNGCHNGETGTRNVHIFARRNHEIAEISDYLTGEHMPILDPYDQPRTFNELQRRADLLQQLVDQGFCTTGRAKRTH